MDREVERLLSVMEAISHGRHTAEIMEFTQPWQSPLIQRIAEAMGMMMVKVEAREFRLETMIVELEDLNRRLKDNAVATVRTIAGLLAARDRYTAGHARRVQAYSVRLARRNGLSDDEVEAVAVGAALHDIGKVGFSDSVFNNEDTVLTDELMAEVSRHPALGAEILSGLEFLGPAVDYVRCHHERLDGGGYPDGLSDGDIPRGAMIIAVADCFDAMTTDRPYQQGMAPDKAFNVLRRLADSSLDRELVELFITEIRENGLEAGHGAGSEDED